MSLIKTAQYVAQEPLTSSLKKSSGEITTRDDTTDIKARTQHTRKLFAWYDQVVADGNLPPSAFKVAYVIGQHVNWQSGEAWPSTDTIASRAGLAQSSVRDMVERLHQCGHLQVTWGSRGRGHPNKYRLIIKERTAAFFDTTKTPRKERTTAVLDEVAKERFRQIKERSGKIKERRSAKNHFITTLTTKQERASGPRSSDASIQSVAGNDGNPADAESPKPIPGAADAARIDVLPDQKLPCQALASKSMVAAANADGGNAAGGCAATPQPGYSEQDFQKLRRIFPLHQDQSEARRAYRAALAESSDIAETVAQLQRGARRYANTAGCPGGLKVKTLAEFILAGNWRSRPAFNFSRVTASEE
jgi:Helix-turn-helix domain